jgi:hypothetical protein
MFDAHTSIIGHGITTRKTIIFTLTTAKSQNLTYTSVTVLETKYLEVQEVEQERENVTLKEGPMVSRKLTRHFRFMVPCIIYNMYE